MASTGPHPEFIIFYIIWPMLFITFGTLSLPIDATKIILRPTDEDIKHFFYFVHIGLLPYYIALVCVIKEEISEKISQMRRMSKCPGRKF